LKKIQWFDANAYPYTQNTPYYPLIDLLTKAFDIRDGDNAEAIKLKVESSLEGLLGKGSENAPYIGSLFSIEYSETKEVSPEYWKDRLYAAIGDVLKALTATAPTVICLEDMHWADPSTMELVRKLVSNLSGPLMVICIYRPVITIFTDFEIKTLSIDYMELRLRELSPSESQDMICSLLNADQIPKELRGFIRNSIDGNPFYVEELINALIDSEALSKDSGQWMLTKTIDDSFISTNIQGVIAGRIDRLGRDTKRTLQEASVIGRAFLFDILQRISQTKEDINKSLVTLERLDLISAKSIQPTLEYIFKHALTQEIVYNGLVKSERRAIHDKIGNVIEILFKDRLSDFSETLAYHFSNGLSINKAIFYLMKSGEKGLQKFALAEAHQAYEKAYNMLFEGEPDQVSERDRHLALILNKWSFVFYYYADWGGLYRLLSKHEDMALQLEDRSATAMFLAWFGWSHLGIGKPTIGEKYLSRAYDISRSIKDYEIMAYVHTWRCWSLVSIGRFDNAIEDGEKALALAEKYDLGRYIHFKTRAGMANAYWYQGDRLKSFEKGQELLAIGEQQGSIPALTFGCVELGASFILDGDYTKALEWLNRGTNEQKDFIYYYACLVMKGMVYFLSEKYEEALNILKPNVEFLNENSRFPWLAVPGELFLGGSLVGQGSFDVGFKIIHEARKKLNEMHYSYFYIVSELMLGSIFSKIVSREADVKLSIIFRNIGFMLKNIASASKNAETHFKNAIGLAQEIGAKGIEGQAWLELGKLYVVKNKKVDARQAVNSSIEIFRLCNIETHRRQAENVLNSIGK
jgi:tetratricopeptide (TPR) repeat protein